MGHALLVNPSYFRTYGSTEGGIAFPVYPILSLAAIAGSLRDRGHTARILDLSYRRYDPALIAQVIRDERPDLVGVTATTPQMNQARDISFLVDDIDPGIVTVAGGSHLSALPAESMRESRFDHVAAGEADHVVADLLDGHDPASIGGLYWRDGEEIIANAATPLFEDLDDLPFPAWDLYPVEGNRKVSKIIARHLPVTSIEFSRGCIYSCDFCASKNTMGRGYRKKSPERCADEVERIAALGYREIVVHDDIFTTDTEWAKQVCEAIIRRGTEIAWTCSNGIRVDALDPELFTLMKRAGCYRVYFGFETGNDEVLKAFGKGGRATLDQGVEAVEMARRAGLEPNGFFLVGLMPDTEASMQDTIDYAKRVRLDVMKCGICVPLPGTPMFRELHDQGRIKTTDWDAYTVYNKAENIFDHPTLEWPTILRYFDRFYRQVYLRPGFVWRRLRYLLTNGELWANIRFTTRFLQMLSRSGSEAGTEDYGYEDRWRPLDLRPDQPLGDYPVPRVRRRGTALTMSRRRTDP